MQFKTFLTATAASLPLVMGLATPAFAQSTGSVEFEKPIVVTGARTSVQAVGGISSPDTAKAKAVITAENIGRQGAGQTVLDTINQVPGVSFQNNDAYGSSGGTLNIRGFDSTRISLTFDGVPLNDSGNYAIFSNQQIDPELIEQVNVNLGTTDVDSPTASAAGGTVNLRTINPSHDLGGKLSLSVGEWNFARVFAKLETGDLTSGGVRAWISGSKATNDLPFNNYGKISKQQYNGKLYIPLSGKDFIAVAGHYNQNRNNFFGSVPLRVDASATRIVGPNTANRFPTTGAERFYNINFPCALANAIAGTADAVAAAPANQAGCGTEFDRRYNPSNTGNIRISSRFTLSPSLVLTVDPSYQYVKANGGGTVSAREGLRDIDPTTAGVLNAAGYWGGTPFFGRDINGDGDTLDTVTVLAPSQTQTRRYGVSTSLRWDADEHNTVRIAYTWDSAKHRQTGEVGLVMPNGEPFDVFPVNAASSQKDVNGTILQKRDRLSYAILHKFAFEYRGEFFDEKLVVNIGASMPFFTRNLTNYCFTSSAGGFVECTGQNAGLNTTAQTLNPYTYTAATATTNTVVTGWAPPQQRILKYKKFLPSLGFVYKMVDSLSLFGNYSKNISVPGTDSLYNSFYYPVGTAPATPVAETTDNFDLGVRYRSGMIQAEFSGYYNQYQNRLASAYDPDLDATVIRNLGSVKKYGIDGYISAQPTDWLQFSVFGGIMKSEIKNNIEISKNTDFTKVFALTAGKRESGAPKYTFGFSARGSLGPVDIGITAKRTGERFITDTNEAIYTGAFIPSGAKTSAGAAPTAPAAPVQIYSATAPAYWLVNLDTRLDLSKLGVPGKSYLQLNVYNLFDQLYVGGFSAALIQANTYSKTTGVSTYGNPTTAQIGAPRTVSASLVVEF
jgi:iron complex outermembrane receptor protein